MTNTTGSEAAAATVQPVAELFTGTASALWATTYNMDLALFNEFLLAGWRSAAQHRRACRPPAHRRRP